MMKLKEGFILRTVAGETVVVPTGDALVMEGEDPESKNPTVPEDPQELTLV